MLIVLEEDILLIVLIVVLYIHGTCCPEGQSWTGVECCDTSRIYNDNMCCKDDGDVVHGVADNKTVCWPSSQIDNNDESCPVDVDSDGNCPETFIRNMRKL